MRFSCSYLFRAPAAAIGRIGSSMVQCPVAFPFHPGRLPHALLRRGCCFGDDVICNRHEARVAAVGNGINSDRNYSGRCCLESVLPALARTIQKSLLRVWLRPIIPRLARFSVRPFEAFAPRSIDLCGSPRRHASRPCNGCRGSAVVIVVALALLISRVRRSVRSCASFRTACRFEV